MSNTLDATVQTKHTIYVLIRLDISLAQQMVQAAHAAAEAGRQFYKSPHGIASLIVLSVANQEKLYAAQAQLHRKGVANTVFFEPDFGIGDSALATEPLLDHQRKYMRGWPLWGAPARKPELEAA
jgi:hypothetical protein